jgi:hypothetical protein
MVLEKKMGDFYSRINISRGWLTYVFDVTNSVANNGMAAAVFRWTQAAKQLLWLRSSVYAHTQAKSTYERLIQIARGGKTES